MLNLARQLTQYFSLMSYIFRCLAIEPEPILRFGSDILLVVVTLIACLLVNIFGLPELLLW
jgi:hypothetical protein